MGVRDPKKIWFLTYPQNDATMEKLLSELSDIADIEEYVIARELHEDGSPHLHAYIKFSGDGVTLKEAPNTFNVIEKSGNYQPARSCKAVISYCMKEENYISNFDVKKYLEKKGKLTTALIKSKSTKTALEDGDIGIHQIRNYQMARSVLTEARETEGPRGIWITGKPGVGKSYAIRKTLCPNSLYVKGQNKWWDNYEGQDYVLIDDFDHGGVKLGHHLKLWSDRYQATAEIKGCQTNLNHKLLFITSNYLPLDIWPDDEELIAAIHRRFEVHTMGEHNRELIINRIKSRL